MDSDEANKEAFRLELNAAIMKYRDAYCEMVSDPNNLALKENYKRVQSFVQEVARTQKERFNNLRNNTGGQTVEAGGSGKSTGQTSSNMSQSSTTATYANKGTTGQYASYATKSASTVTNVKNEVLTRVIIMEQAATDGSHARDLEKIQGDKIAVGPCALYSKKTVEFEKVAMDATGQTEVPAPLNIKVEVQPAEPPHLAIETSPPGLYSVLYCSKSVLAEKVSMDTNGKTEEQSPLIESEDIKTEVPSAPEMEKAQGDRLALGSYAAQPMKSILVKTSVVRGDKKTEHQIPLRRVAKPPGHGMNTSATGAQRKRAGASAGRRNCYKKRRPGPVKEVYSEPAGPSCACANHNEVETNDSVHFVMLDDDHVVVLNDEPPIDSSGSSTSTVSSQETEMVMASQEKFLRVFDLIPLKDQHLHKQKEQKRASRLRKSTANHSQFVYSEDWEDSKKRKKREPSTSTQTQVPLPSKPCSESESESEITQARAYRIVNEAGVESLEEVRMSPDLFASQEDSPRKRTTKPSEGASSGAIASPPQRSSRTSHGRKQVLINCSLMNEEAELLFEYPPSPIKTTPELSSSDRESETTATTSSNSPDSPPPPKNFGLSPMEYEGLMASINTPFIPLLVKPKPSILQRSKSQLCLMGEKLKSDPFRPLIIEVSNPGGEPKLYIPAILRSPGLGKQGFFENGEKSASQFGQDGQPNGDFMPSPRSLLIPRRFPSQDDVCCVCHKPGAVPSNSLLLSSEVLTGCNKCLSFYHVSCSSSTSTAATVKLCPRCAATAHNKSTGPPPKKDEDLKKVLATQQLQLIKEKAALEKRVLELTEVNVDQKLKNSLLLKEEEELLKKIKCAHNFISMFKSESTISQPSDISTS